MKNKRSARDRKKSTPTGMLGSQLAAYSATAAAALALAPNAHAQIINITTFNYSGNTNTVTPPSFVPPATFGHLSFTAGPFKMQFEGVNGTIFINGSKFYRGYALIGGQSGHSVGIADLSATSQALKLNLGDPLKQQIAFDKAGAFGLFASASNRTRTGYVGIKGVNAGHTYYGWLNVQVVTDAENFSPTLVSLVAKKGEPGVFGAYENATAPGIDKFSAGDTGAAIPEPADAAFGLGLLAFGAAGVREMRRRKKQAA